MPHFLVVCRCPPHKKISNTRALCRQPLLVQSSAQLQVAGNQDTYLTSRAEALQNVESTIVELSTIFEQLAHMVSKMLSVS